MADRYPNLPNVSSTLEDGGLQLARQTDLGDSIVILGTAEKGPLNVPVALTGLSQAKATFGSYGAGTLVRGLFEAQGATPQGKDLRGCRVGNATRATLSFAEATGAISVEYDDPTYESSGIAIADAFVMSAKKEGDDYNNATIKMDYIDGRLAVVVWNPITGLESSYSYNADPLQEATVHNVSELVTAINADSNLNDDFEATMKDLDIAFEVDIIASGDAYASGVTVVGDNIRVELRTRLDNLVVGDGGTYPSGVHDVVGLYGDYASNFPTVGNKIVSVDSVYQIAESTGIGIVSGGRGSVDLVNAPYKEETTDKYIGDAAGTSYAAAEAIQVVNGGYIATIEDTAVEVYAWDSVGDVQAASLVVYKTVGGVRSTMALTTDYVATVTAPTPSIDFVTGKVPDPGSIITVDYITEPVSITEYSTRQTALDTLSWQSYFISGNTMTFGGSPPTDLRITYKYKNNFGIGGEVILEDADKGKFLFPAGTPNNWKSALDVATMAAPVTLGFTYTYQPEWITLGFSAVALKGGSDGVIMTNAEKYTALAAGYEALEDYEADIFVPVACYLDDTKAVFNPETGTSETQNAAFHTQLHTFLSDHADGVNEAIGIISTKPATSNLPAGVTTWYKGLTETSTSDVLRAANIMSVFDSKFVSVLSMEPIFSNTEVSLPYTATGESAYAGLMSGLTPGQATTNKRVDGLSGLRYALSRGRLDKLTELRYVTMRMGANGTPGLVITDGVTAAAAGSDYVRISTVRGVFGAMQVVRLTASPFIGEPGDAEGRAALEAAITKGLHSMVESRDIRDFALNITSTVQQQIQGIVDVEMIIVPQFEMRKIRVTVKIRPSL